MGTTNNEIDTYMINHEKQIMGNLIYLGTFSSNQLPSLNTDQLVKGCCLIANYDNSSKSGSHWIGIRINPVNSANIRLAEYFDSYGEKPDYDNGILEDTAKFGPWMNSYSNKIEWNPYDLQAEYGVTCGLYSIWFCLKGLPSRNPLAWAVFAKFPSARINKDQGGLYSVQTSNEQAKEQNDRTIKKLIPIGYIKPLK